MIQTCQQIRWGKEHIKCNRRVVIGISTNDGLGGSLKNIGEVLNTKNSHFVSFAQHDYVKKPKPLVLNYDFVVDTIVEALDGKQIEPLLLVNK